MRQRISDLGLLLVLAVVQWMWPMAAYGIIRRHDIPDQRYVEGAARYQTVGRLITERGECEATLVDIPGMPARLHGAVIITAGHCFAGVLEKDKTFILQNPLIGVHFAEVIQAVFHPDFQIREPGKCPLHDIGIGLINPPVPSPLSPSMLYWQDTSVGELTGRVLRTVGRGVTGRGDINIVFDDHKRRLAENQIIDLDKATLSTDFPENPYGQYLNGFPESGDCGAPGFIETTAGEKLIALFNCAPARSETQAIRKRIQFKDSRAIVEEEIPLDMSLFDFVEGSQERKDALLFDLRDQINRGDGEKKYTHVEPIYGTPSYHVYIPFYREWLQQAVWIFEPSSKKLCGSLWCEEQKE